MEGLKYQITVTVLLSKHKQNGDVEYDPVYFNSATETIIILINMTLINTFNKFHTE